MIENLVVGQTYWCSATPIECEVEVPWQGTLQEEEVSGEIGYILVHTENPECILQAMPEFLFDTREECKQDIIQGALAYILETLGDLQEHIKDIKKAIYE